MNKENSKKSQQNNKDKVNDILIHSIIGKKIGMTQVFNENGETVPVTVIKAGPCEVTGVRTLEKDGYKAIQLGFEDILEKRLNKSQRDYFKQSNITPKRILREIRSSFKKKPELGKEVKVDIFKEGQKVDVSGISKGKGFQGGVKRWGWSIGPKSHGSRSYRKPGSVGASADPARVVKGKRMPGRMGGKKVTVKNLEIVKVDIEKNILALTGSVPGPKGGYLLIKESLTNTKSGS